MSDGRPRVIIAELLYRNRSSLRRPPHFLVSKSLFLLADVQVPGYECFHIYMFSYRTYHALTDVATHQYIHPWPSRAQLSILCLILVGFRERGKKSVHLKIGIVSIKNQLHKCELRIIVYRAATTGACTSSEVMFK